MSRLRGVVEEAKGIAHEMTGHLKALPVHVHNSEDAEGCKAVVKKLRQDLADIDWDRGARDGPGDDAVIE